MKNIRDILEVHNRGQVVENLPFREYTQTPGLNPSTVVTRKESALAARHAYEAPSTDSDDKAFGRLCHSLLFEPDTFLDCWAIWDGGTRRGKEWEAFVEDAGGKEIARQVDADRAAKCVQSALRRPRVQALVRNGISEVCVFTEEETPSGIIQCKGRIDRYDTTGRSLIDAKFTKSVHKGPFGRTCRSFGYTMKMACYWQWLRRCGVEVRRTYFITIQNVAPYDVAVVPIELKTLEDRWHDAKTLINKIAEDVVSDSFHGVDGGADEYVLEEPPDYDFSLEDELQWD